jgi:hypothetical protein
MAERDIAALELGTVDATKVWHRSEARNFRFGLHRHTDTAPLSHQRRTRCPIMAPTAAIMAQSAAYQIETNAVPSFLHARV